MGSPCYNDDAKGKQDGQESHDCIQGIAVKLHVAIDSVSIGVEGIETLYSGGELRNERDDDKCGEAVEQPGGGSMPASDRMRSSGNAESVFEVDHEE